jgi:hypothetical protein
LRQIKIAEPTNVGLGVGEERFAEGLGVEGSVAVGIGDAFSF